MLAQTLLQAYDGVNSTEDPAPAKGDCPHGTRIFPTWHRLYVGLFEQQLQAKAMQIASDYSYEPERYQTAARDLRLPFWDWAAKSVPPKQARSWTSPRLK